MIANLNYIRDAVNKMVVDTQGRPSWNWYADRAVKDVTGVDRFCTMVLASIKPNLLIANIIKSQNGEAVATFFDKDMEGVREELVSILAIGADPSIKPMQYKKLALLYKRVIESLKEETPLVDKFQLLTLIRKNKWKPGELLDFPSKEEEEEEYDEDDDDDADEIDPEMMAKVIEYLTQQGQLSNDVDDEDEGLSPMELIQKKVGFNPNTSDEGTPPKVIPTHKMSDVVSTVSDDEPTFTEVVDEHVEENTIVDNSDKVEESVADANFTPTPPTQKKSKGKYVAALEQMTGVSLDAPDAPSIKELVDRTVVKFEDIPDLCTYPGYESYTPQHVKVESPKKGKDPNEFTPEEEAEIERLYLKELEDEEDEDDPLDDIEKAKILKDVLTEFRTNKKLSACYNTPEELVKWLNNTADDDRIYRYSSEIPEESGYYSDEEWEADYNWRELKRMDLSGKSMARYAEDHREEYDKLSTKDYRIKMGYFKYDELFVYDGEIYSTQEEYPRVYAEVRKNIIPTDYIESFKTTYAMILQHEENRTGKLLTEADKNHVFSEVLRRHKIEISLSTTYDTSEKIVKWLNDNIEVDREYDFLGDIPEDHDCPSDEYWTFENYWRGMRRDRFACESIQRLSEAGIISFVGLTKDEIDKQKKEFCYSEFFIFEGKVYSVLEPNPRPDADPYALTPAETKEIVNKLDATREYDTTDDEHYLNKENALTEARTDKKLSTINNTVEKLVDYLNLHMEIDADFMILGNFPEEHDAENDLIWRDEYNWRKDKRFELAREVALVLHKEDEERAGKKLKMYDRAKGISRTIFYIEGGKLRSKEKVKGFEGIAERYEEDSEEKVSMDKKMSEILRNISELVKYLNHHCHDDFVYYVNKEVPLVHDAVDEFNWLTEYRWRCNKRRELDLIIDKRNREEYLAKHGELPPWRENNNTVGCSEKYEVRYGEVYYIEPDFPPPPPPPMKPREFDPDKNINNFSIEEILQDMAANMVVNGVEGPEDIWVGQNQEWEHEQEFQNVLKDAFEPDEDDDDEEEEDVKEPFKIVIETLDINGDYLDMSEWYYMDEDELKCMDIPKEQEHYMNRSIEDIFGAHRDSQYFFTEDYEAHLDDYRMFMADIFPETIDDKEDDNKFLSDTIDLQNRVEKFREPLKVNAVLGDNPLLYYVEYEYLKSKEEEDFNMTMPEYLRLGYGQGGGDRRAIYLMRTVRRVFFNEELENGWDPTKKGTILCGMNNEEAAKYYEPVYIHRYHCMRDNYEYYKQLLKDKGEEYFFEFLKDNAANVSFVLGFAVDSEGFNISILTGEDRHIFDEIQTMLMEASRSSEEQIAESEKKYGELKEFKEFKICDHVEEEEEVADHEPETAVEEEEETTDTQVIYDHKELLIKDFNRRLEEVRATFDPVLDSEEYRDLELSYLMRFHYSDNEMSLDRFNALPDDEFELHVYRKYRRMPLRRQFYEAGKGMPIYSDMLDKYDLDHEYVEKTYKTNWLKRMRCYRVNIEFYRSLYKKYGRAELSKIFPEKYEEIFEEVIAYPGPSSRSMDTIFGREGKDYGPFTIIEMLHEHEDNLLNKWVPDHVTVKNPPGLANIFKPRKFRYVEDMPPDLMEAIENWVPDEGGDIDLEDTMNRKQRRRFEQWDPSESKNRAKVNKRKKKKKNNNYQTKKSVVSEEVKSEEFTDLAITQDNPSSNTILDDYPAAYEDILKESEAKEELSEEEKARRKAKYDKLKSGIVRIDTVSRTITVDGKPLDEIDDNEVVSGTGVDIDNSSTPGIVSLAPDVDDIVDTKERLTEVCRAVELIGGELLGTVGNVNTDPRNFYSFPQMAQHMQLAINSAFSAKLHDLVITLQPTNEMLMFTLMVHGRVSYQCEKDIRRGVMPHIHDMLSSACERYVANIQKALDLPWKPSYCLSLCESEETMSNDLEKYSDTMRRPSNELTYSDTYVLSALSASLLQLALYYHGFRQIHITYLNDYSGKCELKIHDDRDPKNICDVDNSEKYPLSDLYKDDADYFKERVREFTSMYGKPFTIGAIVHDGGTETNKISPFFDTLFNDTWKNELYKSIEMEDLCGITIGEKTMVSDCVYTVTNLREIKSSGQSIEEYVDKLGDYNQFKKYLPNQSYTPMYPEASIEVKWYVDNVLNMDNLVKDKVLTRIPFLPSFHAKQFGIVNSRENGFVIKTQMTVPDNIMEEYRNRTGK